MDIESESDDNDPLKVKVSDMNTWEEIHIP